MMQGKKEYRILDILSLDIRESDLKRMAAADSGQMEQYILSKLADRDISDLIQKYALPYRELMTYYRCAMMEVSAKFNVLNEELSLQYDRNPIENIRTRLKTPESIAKKLQKREYPLTVESIENNDKHLISTVYNLNTDDLLLLTNFSRSIGWGIFNEIIIV